MKTNIKITENMYFLIKYKCPAFSKLILYISTKFINLIYIIFEL